MPMLIVVYGSLDTSYFANFIYNLNGPVVKALEIKADDLSSNLMRTFK
jgi:hypothetical protein